MRLVKPEVFNRKEIVMVVNLPGLWRIIEITSKNKCTLKEINGPTATVKDMDSLVKHYS